MRKAFRWVYQELELGRSRRSVLRALKKHKAFDRPVREAFRLLDRLSKFDLAAFRPETILLGVDEVGRGPLAGPLVAACVQLPYPDRLNLPFLRDSKKLQPGEREHLATLIKQQASRWSLGVVEAHEFGKELNLHHLTFLAMERAIQNLGPSTDLQGLLVDGKYPVPSWTKGEQRAVIKGDDTSLSIAAASVIAKVYRDERMKELQQRYPEYGFDSHVGYGTQVHREALRRYGPCPEHRTNFLLKILSQ